MNDLPTPDDVEIELSASTPRRVRWTRRTGIFRRIGWNLLLACVCLCYLIGKSKIQQWRQFVAKGVVTNAHVVAKNIQPDNATTYRVNYQFTVGHEVVDGFHDLGLAAYSDTQVGDAVPVTYLPDNPSVYEEGLLGRDYVSTQTSHMVTWMCLGLLIVLLTLLGYEKQFAAERLLLRDGRIAIGVIKGLEPGLISYVATYNVVYPDGSESTAPVAVGQADLGRFAAGKPITLLLQEGQVYAEVPYFRLKFAEVEG